MKVLFISNFLYRFGPPITLFRIIQELKRHNQVKISVFSFLDGPVRKWYENLGLSLTIKNLYENKPENIFELARVIKREKPDLVFTNTLDSINACFAASFCKIPCLLYVYEDWPQINTSLLHLFAFKLADLVVFTNRYQAEVYSPLLEGVPFTIVKEGIPFEEFNPQALPETEEEIKASLGLPPNKKVVSIIGTVCHRKRQDLFVFAAHEILKKRDDIIFLIIGWYREEEPYYQLLKRYLQAGKLEPQIRFMGDQEKVKSYYKISDLLVCPSSNDVSPMVIVEALAFGKPVVATRINGVSKLISHGRNGILIDSGNQKQLEEAISQILEDYPSFSAGVQQTMNHLKKEFSIESTTLAFYQIFKQLKLQKKKAKIELKDKKMEFLINKLSVELKEIFPLIQRDFR